MSLYREFGDALKGVWSLLVGLRVTGSEFAKKQVTVHYPRQVVDNISTFRGHIELVGKPKDPAVPKCISCMMCQSVMSFRLHRYQEIAQDKAHRGSH